jgi:hypothetical protein
MPDRSLGFGGSHVEKAIHSTELSLDFVAVFFQHDEHKDHRCPAWIVFAVG